MSQTGWGVFEDPHVRDMWNRYQDITAALTKGQDLLKLKKETTKKD